RQGSEDALLDFPDFQIRLGHHRQYGGDAGNGVDLAGVPERDRPHVAVTRLALKERGAVRQVPVLAVLTHARRPPRLAAVVGASNTPAHPRRAYSAYRNRRNPKEQDRCRRTTNQCPRTNCRRSWVIRRPFRRGSLSAPRPRSTIRLSDKSQ